MFLEMKTEKRSSYYYTLIVGWRREGSVSFSFFCVCDSEGPRRPEWELVSICWMLFLEAGIKVLVAERLEAVWQLEQL